jgi:hypothetical protein
METILQLYDSQAAPRILVGEQQPNIPCPRNEAEAEPIELPVGA